MYGRQTVKKPLGLDCVIPQPGEVRSLSCMLGEEKGEHREVRAALRAVM